MGFIVSETWLQYQALRQSAIQVFIKMFFALDQSCMLTPSLILWLQTKGEADNNILFFIYLAL